MSKNFTQYLQRYAEPIVNRLDDFPCHHHFQHSLVIPAYKEDVAFVKRFLTSALSSQAILLIVVINQPDNDNNKLPQQTLLKDIALLGEASWVSEQCRLVNLKCCNSAILTIDCFNVALPEKEGVGLARKIGADAAIKLYSTGVVAKPWIGSTDADATLPDHYFNALNGLSEQSVAACFNFTHESEQETIFKATKQYERALRYYVAGLTYAGSRYAFFTIGSVIAFTASSYVNVRGFPKRSAGEDFYLLNKLAKQGQVAWLKDSVVRLEARLSDRVPFGTGPAVSEIIRQTQEGSRYCYYHPQLFVELKSLLLAFEDLVHQFDNYNVWFNQLSDINQQALTFLAFELFFDKQSHGNAKQFSQQLKVWFDAFKTLKYLHYLRDNFFENIPLEQAIATANFQVD
ncbi:hypothetical protein [Thalassotalea ganghwensis]